MRTAVQSSARVASASAAAASPAAYGARLLGQHRLEDARRVARIAQHHLQPPGDEGQQPGMRLVAPDHGQQRPGRFQPGAQVKALAVGGQVLDQVQRRRRSANESLEPSGPSPAANSLSRLLSRSAMASAIAAGLPLTASYCSAMAAATSRGSPPRRA